MHNNKEENVKLINRLSFRVKIAALLIVVSLVLAIGAAVTTNDKFTDITSQSDIEHEAHTKARALPVIRVGYLPIYVDLPLFVAVEQGFFEDLGISVKLERFQSSPDMATALLSDDIDAVASIASATALVTEARDPGRFKIFMIDEATPEAPLSSLVAPEGSDVKSLDDLKGKVLGSFPGPTATILTPAVLEKLGYGQSDVTVISFPPSSHLEIIATKQVDAMVTYEPTVTQAKLKNSARVVSFGFVESHLLNPWPAGSWLISSKMLSDPLDKEAAEKFTSAIYRAVDFIESKPNEAKMHLSEYTQIPKDVAISAPNIGFTRSEFANQAAIQSYANLLLETGELQRNIDTTSLLFNVE
ncbi:ABC transporter substrate-binding protein [Pseudoalteromonas piscicida]|uniref:ABC transporter substrate-binding protein n=1 Tax=Pseudoalteromonas piscicida TaxID=43662 RepID=UPI0030C8F47A